MSALKQIIVDCLAKHPEISSFEISARLGQPLDGVHHGSPTYLLAESRESTGAGDAADALSEVTGLSALMLIEDIGMPADENLGDEAFLPNDEAPR